MIEENQGPQTPDPQTQGINDQQEFKHFETHTEAKSETDKLTLADNEELIPDHQTYNPLYDFILVKGKFYAVRSIPIRKMIEVKKGDESEIKRINAWKTFYTEDGENIRVMEHDKIDGSTVIPAFSADEFLSNLGNRSSLLHRNSQINPRKEPIEKVFKYVRNVVGKNLTLSDGNLSLVSCWIIAAHFNRCFPQFPPLIFGKAGSDAGGTTALMTCSLIPYPIDIFDPTEATLFRLSQYGFSLLIDEIDPDDKDRSKIKILNLILDGSFSKSATIPRATGKDFSVEGFSSYGPKVLIDPYMAIVKPSTLSRSVKVWLERDPTKSVDLEVKEFISLRRNLIEMLYGLFLPYAHKVRKAYDNVNDFTGRQRQAYGPVIAIANMVGVHDQVIYALKPSIESVDMAREGDPVKFVLFALYEYLLKERDDIHSNIDLSDFKRSKDKGFINIELRVLRERLKDRVSEVHQTDENSSSRREWRKIPGDFRQFFESKVFNQIIKNNLPHFVEHVRGDRWGIKLKTVDRDVKDKSEVDPILDRLETILRIGPEHSYRNDIDKTGTMAQFETDESPIIKEESDDDDIRRILG